VAGVILLTGVASFVFLLGRIEPVPEPVGTLTLPASMPG